MPTAPPTVTRRGLLRGGGGAVAAAAAGGALLAACSKAQAPAAASTTSTGAKTTLLVSIPFQGFGNYQGTMQKLTEEYIATHWTAKHKGVEVKTQAGSGANGNNIGSQTIVAASIAGDTAALPATVCGCCSDIQTYLSAGLLVPLDTYIKQDNINLGGFSPGHLQALQAGGRQMALPQYDGPMVLTYNQAMLDQLGLPYPQPGWTHTEAATLWASLSRTVKGKRVYGAALDYGDHNWWLHGWGGAEGDATGTKALLDSPAGVAAFSWFTHLFSQHVATGGGSSNVRGGSAAFGMAGGWTIETMALAARGLKWDYQPLPVFPGGRPSTFINNDFNGINAFSKVPRELAWSIFKFITLDVGFQHFQYRTTFITPNQSNLWADWISIVRAVAPPLRNKHLEYYQQAIDYGWSTYFFKYDALAANNLKGSWFSKIQNGKVSPQLGLQQATLQVNALEAAGARTSTEAAASIRAFPTLGAPIAVVQAGL